MNRKKAQIVTGVVSVAVNAVLFAAKLWAGLVTGSIALVADAWHTMSDSVTSVFVVFAAKLAARKPDKEHPFGHGRWEPISALFMALVLTVVGYEFLTGSIERFRNREAVAYGAAAVVITVISVITKELLAQYAFYIGRRTNNPVVTADGWHSRSDALSSAVVLIGIIVTKVTSGLWWMDSVLGMVCAGMIFYAAWQITRESVTKLLGEEPGPELVDQITAEIKALCGDDLRIHHLHLHNYILQKELTLHIMLDGSLSIENGHKTATEIEKMIETKFAMTATIHVEPL